MVNLSETEKSYIAGLFDGEGTIGYYLKSKSGYHVAQIAIANSDPRIMKWLKDRISFGSVAINKKNKYIGWCWIVNSTNQVKEFLLAVRPYLIIKANQVDLLFSLWDAEQRIRSKHKLSKEVLSLRHDTEQQLKALKTANFQSVH